MVLDPGNWAKESSVPGLVLAPIERMVAETFSTSIPQQESPRQGSGTFHTSRQQRLLCWLLPVFGPQV